MEHFIKTVKQFPIIWNTDSKEYHNLVNKEVAWKRILLEVNDPDIPDVKTAKNEWKKLRDSHRESLKRMYAGSHGASPAKNTWKYAESLEFLLPYMRNRKRYRNANVHNQNTIESQCKSSNIEISENQNYEIQLIQNQNDDSNLSSEQIRPKKRKEEDVKDVNTDFKHKEKTRNPLNMFFDSMCESTKKLPDWIQRDVKKKVLQIVCEAEETYETYLSTQSHQGYTSSSVCSTPLPQNDHGVDQGFPVKIETEKGWEPLA